MTAFTEKLDRAAGAALCKGLEEAGGALIGAGAVSLVFGGPVAVPVALGVAALMASAGGCNWDPNQGEPTPPAGPELCWEGASTFQINQLQNGVFKGGATPEIQRITDQTIEPAGSGGNNQFLELVTYSWVKAGGAIGTTGFFLGSDDSGNFYTLDQVFTGDPTCLVPSPDPSGPEIPPYEYTDPVDGCTLIVNWKGLATDELGHLNPVFKIEPGSDLRTGGGVIGGCNFEPVIYSGPPAGPPGPPIYGPWNPDWDLPGGGQTPWGDFLRDLAGGLLGNAIYDGLTALLEAPYSGTTYRLVSVCEKDASGEPISRAVEETIPSLPINDAILKRLDALVPLLQGQKDFKQPVCDPPKAEGEFRTIGFISEETSPNGKSRLIKRFRYRSVSGIGLDALIDYWKDFTFSAGPVIVQHRGASWGTVKCWAASANEGKRVIRHAAGEAGIDADKVGRWEISGSSSTRLGVSGTMKVNQAGGYYWITARDGSDLSLIHI